MSCFSKIHNYYSQLTVSEKKIADYLVNNPEIAVKFNINELAEAIGCAPSSITKFVKKLKYRSFSDMRFELMRTVDSDSAEGFSEITNWSVSLDSLSQHYVNGITRTFEETLEINDFDNFTKVAELLEGAETVYLFGVGNSSVIARDFQQKLIRLNKRCVFDIDGNFGVQNAMLATSRDLAVCISYSGDTNEVNKAARKIKEANCPLVTITRCAKTPLSSLGDICLFAPNSEQVIRIASIFSRYSFIFMIDIIFLKFARLVGYEPANIIREYRELHQQSPVIDDIS